MLSILSSRNVINSVSKLRIACRSLVKNVKYNNPMFYEPFHSSSKCAFKIKNTRESNKSEVELDLLTVNTNVQNNVLLYKYEKTNDFKILKMIFFGWLFCDITMLLITYNPKYKTTWFEDISWKEYVQKNGTNLIYFLFSTLLGPLFAAFLFVINKKFVKYIILHKGGEDVSIITNHIYPNFNIVTVPVNKVKIRFARDKMRNYLPMKVQGHYLHYFIDAHGEFLNKKLFDYTVGRLKPW